MRSHLACPKMFSMQTTSNPPRQAQESPVGKLAWQSQQAQQGRRFGGGASFSPTLTNIQTYLHYVQYPFFPSAGGCQCKWVGCDSRGSEYKIQIQNKNNGKYLGSYVKKNRGQLGSTCPHKERGTPGPLPRCVGPRYPPGGGNGWAGASGGPAHC